uniref:Integrase, catalytic region, zinc finger, CCHC-type, peptidase aspartic, catalytic n=1 Tax=Tanacetum cinerariifolium TaxID=118510 RepID=A0A699GQI4_TANCI|nr:hypothetical protein [Tanacetum cinerariifolium]
MILSGGDNRPPMLDKNLYDSWKIRMELYMINRENERMILESVENGPLIWPTIEENRVTRTNKYVKLSATEKIQADCDMKATNIILQDLHTTNYDQLHAYHEQHELHANEVRLMCGRNQDPLALVVNHQMTPSHFNAYQYPYNNLQFQQQFSPSQDKVLLVEAQGKGTVLNEEELEFLADPGIPEGPVTQSVITHNAAYQVNDLDAYDFNCDEISIAKAVLMANCLVTVQMFYSRKLKGKKIDDNAAQVSNATTIALGMYKLDPLVLAPKVKNNREAHEYYLKHTME